MKGDMVGLTSRQRLALPIIAAEPTIEGAAEQIGVTRKTVYAWLKQQAFKDALEEARKEYVESGFRTLRLGDKAGGGKDREASGQRAGEHQHPGGGINHRVWSKGP